jgi:mono/diheme cytochrome c family protein
VGISLTLGGQNSLPTTGKMLALRESCRVLRMSRVRYVVSIVLLLLAAGLWFSGLIPHCCGARDEPSKVEAVLARRLRSLSVPSKAKYRTNPLISSPALLQESARHFADHCASCHGNDGSGNTEMGRNLYPQSPDMRLGDTQKLSDGELYYIIHNGVRWTGMPAWGAAANDNDRDSWKLVLFIRHLPNLSPEEIRDMERFNPKSEAEREEEKEEQEFLNGGPAGDATQKPR